MKQLINTLEKFAAFNAKSKEHNGSAYRCSINVKSGWRFVSNGFYMLAIKSNENETPESPDPACILNARVNVKTSIRVNVKELEQAIENADVFAREGAGMLIIDVRNGMAFISAKSEEYGQMTRCLNHAEVNGPDLFIGFNCNFLRNCARYITDKGMVTLEFGKPNTPAFISGDDADKLTCVMPMMTGDCEWVENGATSLYCPQLPGEKSLVLDFTPYTWTEWEFVPQYRYNMETGKSEVIPNDEMPRVSLPACDAVTNELVTIECKAPNYGVSKECPALVRFVAYTPADPINTTQAGPENQDRPDDGKPTKSELMTMLNKERARIRREYKNLPATCAKELTRLYRAFGNLQRKNWKDTLEHMPKADDGALDYITLKTTRALWDKVQAARPTPSPIDVTAEFAQLQTNVTV